MKSNIRFLPYYTALGLLIQSALIYLLLQDVRALTMSLLFSFAIIWFAVLHSNSTRKRYKTTETQLRGDITHLNKEVRRLQKFNKANITTIRKLKVYSKSAMERLKSVNIDFLNTAAYMDTPVLLLDQSGKITWCNMAAERLYAFSSNSLKGEMVSEFLNLRNGLTVEQILADLRKDEQDLEVEIKTGNGKLIWTNSHFSFQRGTEKEIKGVVLVQMDISEIRSNEEQLKESLERAQFAEKELKQIIDKQLETNEQLMLAESKLRTVLEKEQESKGVLNQTIKALQDTQGQLVHSEKMASLGQLTAGIAHEINNPINFIFNGIESLKTSLSDLEVILAKYHEVEGTLAPDKLKEINELKDELEYDLLREDLKDMLVDIKEGAIRTIEIVKGLRVFSRLDEEDQKEADINECLDATITLLNNKLKNNVELTRTFDPHLERIQCYPGQLNQVFMNMINNSIQAFKDDHPNPEIEVATYSNDTELTIMIKDNGIGMSEETRNRIFEPFYTTKPVGVGTGLGMSISFGIIEKHGGRIELDTKLGVGTEFRIILPKTTENEFEYGSDRINAQA
ncbi:MAG: PAS domain-containing protein [Ekhidna sp.]|nr:PAS domain-containing protein [Ekhidna sp.]